MIETLLSLVFSKAERKPYVTSPPIETDALKVNRFAIVRRYLKKNLTKNSGVIAFLSFWIENFFSDFFENEELGASMKEQLGQLSIYKEYAKVCDWVEFLA